MLDQLNRRVLGPFFIRPDRAIPDGGGPVENFVDILVSRGKGGLVQLCLQEPGQFFLLVLVREITTEFVRKLDPELSYEALQDMICQRRARFINEIVGGKRT